MCGICGYISFDRQDVLPAVLEMTQNLSHRGPDDWGIYTNSVEATIDDRVKLTQDALPPYALGHRRLSIFDLSQLGHQPMVDVQNELVIVFNGAIYNFPELKTQLAKSYHFKSQSDTEVLLACYVKWGVRMLEHLDGMFAFVIFDKKKKKVFVARDPIGIKPFYYYFDKSKFLFASEPSVIKSDKKNLNDIDLTRTAEFVLLAISDHDEGTFYNEIKQLRGGHYMEIDLSLGTSKIQKYWTPPSIIPSPEIDPFVKYPEVIKTAIAHQLRSDVSLGSSLSGGIDSSTIVTLASEILGDSASHYKTLTFTMPDYPDDESKLAQSVAKKSGLQWLEVNPSLSMLEADLKKMVISMGEPFSTLSMFAQYKVMQKAKEEGLKVLLDGQGGDEVYLGYPRIVQRVIGHNFSIKNIAGTLREIKDLNNNLSISYSNMMMSSIYFNSKNIAYTIKKRTFSRYLSKDLIHLVRDETLEDLFANKNIYEKQNDELTKYILPRLLRFADRNSMAFGVEQRVPHLSKLILEYNLSLPIDYRVYRGWSKYLVRKSMAGKVPDSIIWDNKKRGFGVPQSYWVNHIKSYIYDVINSNDKLDVLFNRKNILEDIKDNKRQSSPHLWRIISTILWIESKKLKL